MRSVFVMVLLVLPAWVMGQSIKLAGYFTQDQKAF